MRLALHLATLPSVTLAVQPARFQTSTIQERANDELPMASDASGVPPHHGHVMFGTRKELQGELPAQTEKKATHAGAGAYVARGRRHAHGRCGASSDDGRDGGRQHVLMSDKSGRHPWDTMPCMHGRGGGRGLIAPHRRRGICMP